MSGHLRTTLSIRPCALSLIVDRIGIRTLRDPYSSKPYVLFYTTKRVGGGIQDISAIKLLKFGVS